jgi:Na+/H+ antiporter NhaD/arsenite permease-like protein
VSIALIIFAAAYAVIALGRLPGLRVDRTGAAIIGAALMLAFGVLTPRAAYRSIDGNTLVLLFGMMIVTANLRLAGVFTWLAARIARRARHPLGLLAGVVLIAGFLSAFFVNDAVCVALTPLVLDIVESLGRDALPYLLAVAMASNAGSVATITGNPQNMLVASFSGIGYRGFAAALAPVGAMAMVIVFGAIALLHRREFFSGARLAAASAPVPVARGLAWKSGAVAFAIVVAFFAGAPAPVAALLGGAALLLTRRLSPERIYSEIDWPLLAMFAGLFVIVAGFETTSVMQRLTAAASGFGLNATGVLSAASAGMSNLVSNVPAVLLFKPLVPHLAQPRRAWLALAMSSTLAGNLTPVGSVANLIVLQRAAARRRIGFWAYARVGIPVTIVTLALGVLWLR